MKSVQVKSYVYKGTHKETGQIYFGARSSHVKSNRTIAEDFGIHYFTSSKKVKELGFDNFWWSLEFVCDDPSEAFLLEDELIRLQLAKDKSLSLNQRYFGGWNVSGPKSLEHRKKLSLSHIGKPGPCKGRKHSEESKQKMSTSGKIKLFSKEHRKKLSLASSGINNPMFGNGFKLNGDKNGMFEYKWPRCSCVICKKEVNFPNLQRHHKHE